MPGRHLLSFDSDSWDIYFETPGKYKYRHISIKQHIFEIKIDIYMLFYRYMSIYLYLPGVSK